MGQRPFRLRTEEPLESQTAHTPTVRKVERPCPVCGGRVARQLLRQSFQSLGEVGLLAGYDVVVCEVCGAGYADGIPEQPAFDAYYANFSKYEYRLREGKESSRDQERFAEVAGIISRHIPNREARVLDVGCGNGRLVSLLRQLGFVNAKGLDPSPGCAQVAKERYGVTVLTHSLFSLPDNCEQDFLTLLGVLEHIRDLDRALENIRKIAADNAILYIEVPDFAHLEAQQDAPFQEFSNEHINFFSAGSLSNLLRRAGWKELACSSEKRSAGQGGLSSVVCGIFRKISSPDTQLVRDEQTLTGLIRYIAECGELDRGLRARIDAALPPGAPLIVWGVGTHTRRLLASGALNNARIVAFVDSDPRFQGQQISDVPVIAPDEVQSRKEPILISSFAFQEEIRRYIEVDLGMKNQLILLYPTSR